MRQLKTRIMYIESKSGTLNGPARIGRVTFSKTGKSLTYRGRTFQSLKGRGFKANYFDVDTDEEFWISGPRKDGQDRLHAESNRPIEIDGDVAEEYWRDFRGLEHAPTQVFPLRQQRTSTAVHQIRNLSVGVDAWSQPS